MGRDVANKSFNTGGADIQLASQSPRRRELLDQIGVRYSVVNVDVDESRHPDESAEHFVSRLAIEKAKAGFTASPKLPTLGSDTVVMCAGSVLGKPAGQTEAANMLRMLSGSSHKVLTAVSLIDAVNSHTLLSVSHVRFRSIQENEIEHYWQTGEPLDKAGAYAIQGKGAIFVEKLEGSYSGVMGLPLSETAQLLALFGIACWY